MVSISQLQLAKRSSLIVYALKTVRILFGVMVVTSYAYSLFASLTTDKSHVMQMIMVAIDFTVPFVLGWLINKKHPGHIIARLFLIMAYSLAVGGIAEATRYLTESLSTPYAASIHSIALDLGEISWMPSVFFYVFLIPLYFPTGKLLSPRWRVLVLFGIGIQIWMTVSVIFRPWPAGDIRGTRSINGIPGSERFFDTVQNFLVIPALFAVLFILISVFLRYQRSRGVERIQMKWPVAAIVMYVFLGILYNTLPGLKTIDAALDYPIVWSLVMLFPISISIAILCHHLFDIDILINRTLVYGALTVGTVVLYILVVGTLSIVSQTTGNLLISLLATGLIAFLFQPLRERLQRGVNRLMYGERDEPYVVLSQLGQRLETVLAPTAILSTIVEAIGRALKLPFVEICLSDDQTQSVSFGKPQPTTTAFPLTYQNEAVGELHIAPRPGESLSSADHKLLEDLARQTGIAIHAAQVTVDLQRSRERLVLAREEERRRLRRDLHDDLAPTLASLGLTASTAADLIPINPVMATRLVKELQAEIRATVGNIRRLVYDLRPPTLDELGLLAAVCERAAQYSNAPDGFHVTVDVPNELPALPAAVEVAAYRIVQEALENVSKHAQARQCTIRFVNHNGLEIEITDNGIGLPSNITPGIGLRSMRERAEELGGSYVIERFLSGGTRIMAHLPIGEFDGSVAHPDRR
jgi:signal transduction histidine kinase